MIVIGTVTKRAVGRLRPNFFDVCKPSQYSCTGNRLTLIEFIYKSIISATSQTMFVKGKMRKK